jgi:hypothetical protein
MEALKAEIIFPTDQGQELKLRKKNNRSFAKEELMLSYGKSDIMIFLYPFESMKFDFPHLEFNRVITHLASNAPEDHIFIYSLPESEIIDWAGEARFKVKDRISSKNFGTAQGYFRDKKGMYIVVYLDSKLQTEFQKVIEFVEDYDRKQE